MEQQVQRLVERDFVPPEQVDPAADATALQGGIRPQSLEAEKHGAVGAMPAARQGERSVELRGDLGRAAEKVPRRQQLDEIARRIHGPHGVRARRADADLEDIENAETHE
jgi:hypothetical protein